jgi:malto-oligosyltrehalose trehalohydrolase
VNEFHLDGLRLDAVHAIHDDTGNHIVREIAQALGDGPGRDRPVHLVLENERNDSRFLDRRDAHAAAQWNDPWHHCVHVLCTGETDGYYAGFAKDTAGLLARSFAEGFDAQLPGEAFMPFLQNHDQVGNRAMGERLATLAPREGLRLATAALLLAPQVPLIFMGEEFGARTPFLYFCDFEGELARAVREGRRKEFAAFANFASPESREKIPDPNAERTFTASKLDWEHRDIEWLAFFRALLALRREFIVPLLASKRRAARFEAKGRNGVAVDWTFGDGSVLHLRANFGPDPEPALAPARGALLHSEGDCGVPGGMPPWGGAWNLETA